MFSSLFHSNKLIIYKTLNYGFFKNGWTVWPLENWSKKIYFLYSVVQILCIQSVPKMYEKVLPQNSWGLNMEM